MKNNIILIIGIMFFAACSKPATIVTEQNHDMTKNDSIDIEIYTTVFSSPDQKTDEKCIILNDTITNLILKLKQDISVASEKYLADCKELKFEPIGAMQLLVHDSVFMTSQDIISLRIMSYTFTGGAHGNVDYYFYNYSVKDGKFLTSNDILIDSEQAVIDKALSTNFSNKDQCFTDKPTVGTLSGINITTENILFTYAPYILGPWVCGSAEIAVPRKDIRKALKL